MRTKWIPLLVAGLTLCTGVRADDVAAYLGYQYADEADHGFGPGVSYSIPLEYSLRVDGRLAYYHFPHIDLDMIPLAIVGTYEYAWDDATTLYGGLGVGYYFMIANRGNVEDDFGFQLLGGGKWQLNRPWSCFAELRWLFLEADVDGEFQASENSDESISLDGIGLNIGLTYSF